VARIRKESASAEIAEICESIETVFMSIGPFSSRPHAEMSQLLLPM